jgi:hypothetical protein
VGVTNLRVGGREDLNCLDYHYQEMRGKMGEVSLQKSLQHRAGSHLAVRARSQGRAASERAGHQARVVEAAKRVVAGNNRAHS